LSELTEVEIADTSDFGDVLFHGELVVEWHVEVTYNLDWFDDVAADRKATSVVDSNQT
jgi:hypothetical protein